MDELEGVGGTTGMVAQARTRLDPRSGKQISLQPESFWRDHEERREASGQPIPQYCEEQGLALSTYRRWRARLSGQVPSRTRRQKRALREPSSPANFLSVPIHAPSAAVDPRSLPISEIEVELRGGVKLRLHGEAARRAIDVVLGELAGAR